MPDPVLVAQIKDALSGVQAAGVDPKLLGAVIPAVVSARITNGSMGGLLRRLFGSDPLDLPFCYQPQDYPMTVPASTAPVQSTVFVSQDSDFYAQRMALTSGNDGSGTFDFRVNLQWGGNDRRWVNSVAGIHALAVQGTGQRPFIFPNPIYLPANGQLIVSLTSITSTGRTVFVDFLGRKAADAASLDLTSRRS